MSVLPQIQRRFICTLSAAFALTAVAASTLVAQTIDVPAPRAATNAAIHYQRAILLLGSLDAEQLEMLQKPIWQIVTPNSTEEELAGLGKVLITSRHAIRSALTGAEQLEADFGLDLRQYMVSAQTPHAEGMKILGRLVALHGMRLQSQGDWKSAVETYLAGLRMGREMTHQTTLAEALAGVEILETMYFSVAHWAVRCPEAELVSDMKHIVEAMSGDMVNPARTMRFEASISKMRLEAMEQSFPDGPWAEMILESLDAKMPVGDPEAMKQAAIKAAGERGVPAKAFASRESFVKYLEGIRTSYAALARDAAICLTKPAPESIKCGQETFAKYADKLPATERLSALNPARVAGLFAVHQAELDILRQVLAVTSSKTAAGYPATIPSGAFDCPFEGSKYEYKQLEEGKGFMVKIGKAMVGDIELPEIKFEHVDAE